jgi:hypothetical protein
LYTVNDSVGVVVESVAAWLTAGIKENSADTNIVAKWRDFIRSITLLKEL